MTTTTIEAKSRAPGKGVPGGIPFAAMLPGNKEWESASNQLFQSWKQQLDTNLKLIDALVQGTLEMRSSQLAAAMETHDRDMTAENSVIGAKSAMDLWAIQMNWMAGNLERSMAYWNQLMQATVDANSKLVECLREQAQAPAAVEQPAKAK
jgi:hypothetical protein